jgi:hypothetical protein
VVLPDGTEEVLLFGGASADYQYSWSEFGSKTLLRLVEATTIFFGMMIKIHWLDCTCKYSASLYLMLMNYIIIIGSVVHAVKSRGQLDILRQNADLTRFVIEGDFTGRKLGSGFFGSVEEVRNFKP